MIHEWIEDRRREWWFDVGGRKRGRFESRV